MTCSNDCYTACNVCGGNSSTCGCNASSSGVTPFYNEACGIQEGHTKVCVQNQFSTGVSVANSFNMPACNGTIILTIPGLQIITVGSYLWHPTYGYLKIISFDFATSTVVAKNECQDGNAAPGTAIPACTVFNVVDTPAGIDNPCTNSPVAEGALVVCANGITQTLDAASVGQVPVVTDAANNLVEFQTLNIPASVCTVLDADLTIIAGNTGPYTLVVTNALLFTTNDILQLGNRADRFLVTGVTDPTHLVTTLSPAPAGFEVIPAGTPVCLAPCCEQIDYYLFNPCNWDLSDRFVLSALEVFGTVGGPGNVHVGDPAGLSPDNGFTITNPYCKPIIAHVDFVFKGEGETQGAVDGDYFHTRTYPQIGFTIAAIGAAPVPTPTTIQNMDNTHIEVDAPNVETRKFSFWYTYSNFYIIPAGQEIRFLSRYALELIAATAGNHYHYDKLSVDARYMLVSF